MTWVGRCHDRTKFLHSLNNCPTCICSVWRRCWLCYVSQQTATDCILSRYQNKPQENPSGKSLLQCVTLLGKINSWAACAISDQMRSILKWAIGKNSMEADLFFLFFHISSSVYTDVLNSLSLKNRGYTMSWDSVQ